MKTRLFLLVLLCVSSHAFSQRDTMVIVGGKLIFSKADKKVKPAAVPRLSSKVTTIGKGSGTINLKNISNKKIKIKSGTYTGINIENVSNLKVDASNVKVINGSLDINTANRLEISGLTIRDVSYRAVNIRGFCNDLYLHDMTFRNIANNTITYEYAPVYDGTDQTVSKNWKFERLTFENTGTGFSAGGGYEGNNVFGLLRNFKFLNNTIRNCPYIGNIVYSGAAEDYEIAGNIVDNVNTSYSKEAPNGIHNGIFMITGTGSFHHNKITNHQGNAIRAWGMNYGREKKDILIYNNTVYNSWKYSAFELQATPDMQSFITKNPSKAGFANAKVYNNTAGRLNISKDWEGQLLDVYTTGGTLEYYNNLGFEMNRSEGEVTDMINWNGKTTVTRNTDNRYFSTESKAVANTNTFDTRYKGIGASAFTYQ